MPDSIKQINKGSKRRGQRRLNKNADAKARSNLKPVTAGIEGGHYQPLSQSQITRIDLAVHSILVKTGFSDAPPIVVETMTKAGCKMDRDNRLTIPSALLDKAIDGMCRRFTLCGQTPGRDMHMTGKRVYAGSGGAAPFVIDIESGKYRDATLRDLYDAARLVNALDNIHFFSRSLVARDMPDNFSLDINTAYASPLLRVLPTVNWPMHKAASKKV